MKFQALACPLPLLALACAVSVPTAIAQTAAPSRPASPPPVTAITLMAAVIPVADLDRATAFYTRGMGLTAARGANPREMVLQFPGGGTTIMLYKIDPAATSGPRPGTGRAILQVPNLKALAARLEAAGYHLQGKINENAQYRISIGGVDDPDGNSLELIQRGG